MNSFNFIKIYSHFLDFVHCRKLFEEQSAARDAIYRRPVLEWQPANGGGGFGSGTRMVGSNTAV